MSAKSLTETPPPARRCPLCNKAASVRYRPFCSKRCADLDLGRWLGEVYRIPFQRADEEDATEDGPEDESSIKGTPRRPFDQDEPDDETP